MQNVFGDDKLMQERLWLLETYEHVSPDTIVKTVKNDLLSQEVLVQDAGCIVLLKTVERLKKKDGTSESIINRLAGDPRVVAAAAGIVDSRLLGWYNPEWSEENDDDIKMYLPLFFILGKADCKNARETLSRAFLYLKGHRDVLETIPLNEELASVSLKRLKDLENKLCCVYPGRGAVVEMFEKDSRYGMLELFENYCAAHPVPSEKMKKKIKEFVLDCLKYGDSKNGSVIRSKAVQLAGILVKSGDGELLGRIREVSQTDPYCTHAYFNRAGYSLTELNYPVREACLKVLSR